MCQIMVDVPDEVLHDTHMNTEDATIFARKMVALGYYTHNNVSLGYCSEIAGLSEEEFIAFLGQNKIDIFRFENKEVPTRYTVDLVHLIKLTNWAMEMEIG